MALVVVMPLQVSNAPMSLQRKIFFLSFTVSHLLEQKNIFSITSKVRWWHLLEAQVSTACKQKVNIKNNQPV